MPVDGRRHELLDGTRARSSSSVSPPGTPRSARARPSSSTRMGRASSWILAAVNPDLNDLQRAPVIG